MDILALKVEHKSSYYLGYDVSLLFRNCNIIIRAQNTRRNKRSLIYLPSTKQVNSLIHFGVTKNILSRIRSIYIFARLYHAKMSVYEPKKSKECLIHSPSTHQMNVFVQYNSKTNFSSLIWSVLVSKSTHKKGAQIISLICFLQVRKLKLSIKQLWLNRYWKSSALLYFIVKLVKAYPLTIPVLLWKFLECFVFRYFPCIKTK